MPTAKRPSRRRKLTAYTDYEQLPPPSAAEVKALRARLGLSQTKFAVVLNVGVRSVQAWEQGTRAPDGSTTSLLKLLDQLGDVALNVLKP